MSTRLAALSLGLPLVIGCGSASEDEGELLGSVKQSITRGDLETLVSAPGTSAVRLGNKFYASQFIPGDLFCSAVKIGPRRFLTAAHCGDGITPSASSPAKVLITNHLCGKPFPNGSGCSRQTGAVEIEVDRFFPHPNWRNDFGLGVDLGVLDVRVDTPSIPVATLDTSLFPDYVEGLMYGYGCDATHVSNLEDRRGQKQFAFLFSTGTTEIRQLEPLTPAQVTALHANNIVTDGWPNPHVGPIHACLGDSGGPFFTLDNKIAGITSGAWPESGLSVFARVVNHRGWINSPVPANTTLAGTIANHVTGRCLSANNSTTDGARVVTAFCDGRNGQFDTQYWRRTATRIPETFTLQNGQSGYCLTSEGFTAGDRVVQRQCNGRADQDWEIRTFSGEIKNRQSGMRLGENVTLANFATYHGVDQSNQTANRTRWTVR